MLACGIRFYIQSLPGGLDEPAMETINHYRCCSLVDQHRIRNQWCEFHWTFVESFLCSSDSDRREQRALLRDRKSTRLNSSHVRISYAVFCLKKKKQDTRSSLQVRNPVALTS